MTGRGPAIVAGAEATIVVPPGFGFRVDEVDSLVLTRAAARAALGRRVGVATSGS